jgi:hypothetical protein
MKNRIILSVVIILVGIAGILGFNYYSSFHKVSIAFSPDMNGATIFKESGDEVKRLSSSGDISVQNGNYYIIPEGEKVSKEKINFSIKDSEQSLTLDPDYSTDYLDVALVNEQTAITAALTATFPVSTEYSTTESKLYYKGEWYGAILTQNVSDPSEEPDTYKVVLHKKDGVWRVINSPVLVLTKSDFKDVPLRILKAINRLDQ